MSSPTARCVCGHPARLHQDLRCLGSVRKTRAGAGRTWNTPCLCERFHEKPAPRAPVQFSLALQLPLLTPKLGCEHASPEPCAFCRTLIGEVPR